VAANGSIVMSGTASGGQTQFNGFLNPATGELIGTWRMPSGAQGMFQGKRQ
jgi:hypothetical protein